MFKQVTKAVLEEILSLRNADSRHGWAHVKCGENDDFYVCVHCLSDNDQFFMLHCSL